MAFPGRCIRQADGKPAIAGLALILLSSADVGKTDPFLAYRGLGGKLRFQENANGFPNICIKWEEREKPSQSEYYFFILDKTTQMKTLWKTFLLFR